MSRTDTPEKEKYNEAYEEAKSINAANAFGIFDSSNALFEFKSWMLFRQWRKKSIA